MASKMRWSSDAVPTILNKARARRELAAKTLADALRKVVGVPAPQARGSSGRFSSRRAPATPGAPPRKITGKGQSGIKEVNTPRRSLVVSEVFYMAIHERGDHPWFWKTIESMTPKLKRIMEKGR